MGLKGKWVQIFAAGTHTDSSGKTKTFTTDDLQKISTKYNERVATGTAGDRATAVKGHPAVGDSSAPAWAWLAETKVEDEKLFARFEDIV